MCQAFLIGTLFAVAASRIALAQDLRPPVLGFVLDRSVHGVRPILGIPGANSIGPVIGSLPPIYGLAVSPRQDFLLVLAGDARELAVLRPDSTEEPRRAPADISAGADELILSRDASVALLYFREAKRAEIVVGLPDRPALSRSIDLEPLKAATKAFAVTDQGLVLTSTESPAGDDSAAAYGISVFPPGSQATAIPFDAPVHAITFAANGKDAIAAAGDKIVLIADVAVEPHIAPADTGDLTFMSPAAMAPTEDGERLIVVDPQAHRTVILSFRGASPVVVDCYCSPTELSRLGRKLLYSVNVYSTDPLWMLDVSGMQARMLFAPPFRDGEPEQ